MAETLDSKKIDEIREAMMRLGLGEILVDRMVRGWLLPCNEACLSGCAACCSSGTANRAVSAP